jgi:hypothetical protein
MAGSKAPISSILSSVALAVVTLSVFWVERDTGPSGVVKMFNLLVQSEQLDRLDTVSLALGDYEAASRLNYSVLLAQEVFKQHGEFTIVDTQVNGRNALVSGAYQVGQRRLVTYWILTRSPDGWKINFYDTSRYMDEMHMRGQN